MITYKVTRKSQMFIVNELSQRAIVFFGGLVVFHILYPKISTDDFLFGFSMISSAIIWYCLWELLPLPFVHFQYLEYNKHTELSIDKNRRIMIVKEEDNVVSFRFDQIRIIHLAMMGTIINGRKHGFITVNRYHYALIETQDGHRFFITCLLINNLMNFFDENRLYYEKEQIYWPRIRLGRYKKS